MAQAHIEPLLVLNNRRIVAELATWLPDSRARVGVITTRDSIEGLDGDTITGESEFEFGGEVRKREWIATREDE